MQQRYVFLMLGFLGSGKSYVSRWLTPHTDAVYLRVDDLRLTMFGEDRPELYTPENKALVNNASKYAMEQILKSGQANVVLDANHNSREIRKQIAKDVAAYNAKAIVVWVQTPLDIAKERTEVRTVNEGHVLFEPNLVEKMAKRLEEPDEDETVIVIDGLMTGEEQRGSFEEHLMRIFHR